jgi:hypothetical protein
MDLRQMQALWIYRLLPKVTENCPVFHYIEGFRYQHTKIRDAFVLGRYRQRSGINRSGITRYYCIPLHGNFGYRDIPVIWHITLVGYFSVFSDVGSLRCLNFSILFPLYRALGNLVPLLL